MNYLPDNMWELLDRYFPDRIPDAADYNSEDILIAIGNQQVIRYLKRLEKENS